MARRKGKLTQEQVLAAIDMIRRAHPSQYREIAAKLPIELQELIGSARQDLVDEVGEDTVLQVESLFAYENGAASFRVLRHKLYENW